MSAAAEPIVLHSENRSFEPDRYRFGATAHDVTILGSRSDATGRTFWPPMIRCPQTGGTVSAVQLASEGALWSWTFVNAPWLGTVSPSGTDGYGVGLVDLDDDGPRIPVVLVGDEVAWTIGEGMRAVELPYQEVDGLLRSLLAFRRIGS